MASVVKQVIVVILAVPLVMLIAGRVAYWADNERHFGGKTDINSPISKYVISPEAETPVPQCRSQACTFATSPALAATVALGESLNDPASLVLPPAVQFAAPPGGYFSDINKLFNSINVVVRPEDVASGLPFKLMSEHQASGAVSDVKIKEQGVLVAVVPAESGEKYASVAWQPVPVMLTVRLAKQRLTQLQIGDQALVFWNVEDAHRLDMQQLPSSSSVLTQVSAIEPLVGANDALVSLKPVAGALYHGEPAAWLARRAHDAYNQRLPKVLSESVHVTAWRATNATSAKGDNPRSAAFRVQKTALSASCAKPAQLSQLDASPAAPPVTTSTALPLGADASCVWLLQRDFAVPVQVRIVRDYGDSVTVVERPVFAGLAIAAADWQALQRRQRRQLSSSGGWLSNGTIINAANATLSAGMAARQREGAAPAS